MSVAARKLYWITAAVFLMIVFLSYHKSTGPSSYPSDRTAPNDVSQSQNYDDNDNDYTSGDGDNLYTGDNKPPGGGYTPPASDNKPATPPTTAGTTPTTPNTSGKYDTLVVIPSSWTQIQNRQWVRETIFGIRDNLEPCKKNDGNIIYKFYIYGRSTWGKSAIHSPEYNQALVRDLYGEFMEFNDHHFTNATVADKYAIWGNALDWAMTTYIPTIKIQVDKVLIFDSTAIVNLPKMEEAVKASANPKGYLQIWGTDSTTFAAMISFNALEQLLKDREEITAAHATEDIISAASTFYAEKPATFKIIPVTGQLWASNIDLVPTDATVVGQVYQLEDWRRITDKLTINPTPACAVDQNRKKNIALLTSSYIYVDMCMAEASLPSADNKRDYADKHGYDFVARAAEFAQEEHRGRRLVWGKIGAIQKVLPHYEWLFWMDMDAIIADLDKDLRDIIRFAEQAKLKDGGDEVSLIVARPNADKKLNAGVMLIKNTEWSRAFFAEVQTRDPWYYKSSYEQAAIWEVMGEPKWSSGVYLYNGDDHTMNTFPKLYAKDDFVIHFAPAGCPSVPVLAALAKIKAGESAVGIGAE
ncbi:hypothetical protein BGZ47_010357 [Haplosporangium gracile]|nr:hypothetical protein BGZ47_010357 [Haplosporangium gracile]